MPEKGDAIVKAIKNFSFVSSIAKDLQPNQYEGCRSPLLMDAGFITENYKSLTKKLCCR
jgi:hypothetical protein